MNGTIRSAAVLGAGVMGAQIAAHLADAGLRVLLLDLPARQGPADAIVRGGLARLAKTSPPATHTDRTLERIRTATFDEIARLRDVDWIVEAVVEDLPTKRALLARVEEAASSSAVVSTNTSGLPIHRVCEGRSTSFRRRFLGTHFFNPPRYLELLEVIPGPDTAPEVVARVAEFARVRLGKGVVTTSDTPGFLANRLGLFAFQRATAAFLDGSYTIEEIDALTGKAIGRPKTATFRTADLAGLDVLLHVLEGLHAALPPGEREAFEPSALLRRLVEAKRLGEKTKAGFYGKRDGRVLSVDPTTLDYREPRPLRLEGWDEILAEPDVAARLRRLLDDPGRPGAFFRATVLPTLAYAARLVPEVVATPGEVDRAMRWGFGWTLGPFQTWDALGLDRVRARMAQQDLTLPAWIADEMPRRAARAFQRRIPVGTQSWAPGHGWRDDERHADEIDRQTLPEMARTGEDGAVLLRDLGYGVLLAELRTKANTLTRGAVEGLHEALDRLDGARWRAMVLDDDGDHFSVGAHLGEIAEAALRRQHREIERLVGRFQDLGRRIRTSEHPVIVSVHGRTLGGGCEFLLACPHPVAAAESYVGLVEVGVGLIPAGGGSARMAAMAAARAKSPHARDLQPHVERAFETVGRARVSRSAAEAVELGFLPPGAPIVMNQRRRLWVAKQEALRLLAQGHVPEPEIATVRVAGAAGMAPMLVAVDHLRRGGFVGGHDAEVATRLARVMTAGDLVPGATDVPFERLLALEREAFLDLLSSLGTQKRIATLLAKGR